MGIRWHSSLVSMRRSWQTASSVKHPFGRWTWPAFDTGRRKCGDKRESLAPSSLAWIVQDDNLQVILLAHLNYHVFWRVWPWNAERSRVEAIWECCYLLAGIMLGRIWHNKAALWSFDDLDADTPFTDMIRSCSLTLASGLSWTIARAHMNPVT